jgi:hypothetical protein
LSFTGLLPGLFACLLPAAANAHSLPFGTGLVWPDAASSALPLIVTNRGLVFPDERSGQVSYSIRCQDAYHANTSDRPSMFVQADGTLTIGGYDEVYQTRDRGCSVSSAQGLPELPVSEPVADVNTPSRMFLTTRSLAQVAGLYVSEDHGASWSERFKNNAKEYYEQLLVAPSDPLTLYAAGIRADAETVEVTFYCSRSRDGGKSWQDHAMDGKVVPFAVHPQDANVVFAHRATDKLESSFDILRSGDGGQTFQLALAGIREPTGLVASPDGAALLLGVDTNEGGLYRSLDNGRSFVRVLADQLQRVTCLAQHAGRLWLCGNMAPNVEGVWVSDDAASSFANVMTFAAVTQPVLCEGAALALCAGDWYDFDLEVRPATADAGVDSDAAADAASPEPDADPELDAGVADASTDAAAPPRRGDGGCQAQPRGRASASSALLLLALLGLARRASARLTKRERRQRA